MNMKIPQILSYTIVLNLSAACIKTIRPSSDTAIVHQLVQTSANYIYEEESSWRKIKLDSVFVTFSTYYSNIESDTLFNLSSVSPPIFTDPVFSYKQTFQPYLNTYHLTYLFITIYKISKQPNTYTMEIGYGLEEEVVQKIIFDSVQYQVIDVKFLQMVVQ